MSRVRKSLALLAVLCASAESAQADPERYVGSHPIPEHIKGNYCYIEIAHNHGYSPDSSEFVMTEKGRDFVGDPSEHGYEGPLFGYSGPHVALREGGDTCYRDGEHFHDQLPQDAEKFIEKDGVLHAREFSKAELAALDAAEEKPEEPRITMPKTVVKKSTPRRRSPARKKRRSKPKSSTAPAPIAKVPVPKPTSSPKPTPSAKPTSSPKPSKPKKSAHRSWMDRRMGR